MMQDILLEGLFTPPIGGAAAALSRLLPGRLWTAFLPGADASSALVLLGSSAADTLALALSAVADVETSLAHAGFPFSWDGSTTDLANALLLDGRREALRPIARGGCKIEFRHAGRSAWEEAVNACLDHAAQEFRNGRVPDVLDVLLTAPNVDLRAIAGIADANARLRFAAGLSLADGNPQRFAGSYFRRSAAEGILQTVASALEGFPTLSRGRTDCGWPAWCEVAGNDTSDVSGIPAAVLSGWSAGPVGCVL